MKSPVSVATDQSRARAHEEQVGGARNKARIVVYEANGKHYSFRCSPSDGLSLVKAMGTVVFTMDAPTFPEASELAIKEARKRNIKQVETLF